jgi:hypothetical protein
MPCFPISSFFIHGAHPTFRESQIRHGCRRISFDGRISFAKRQSVFPYTFIFKKKKPMMKGSTHEALLTLTA